MKKFISFSLGPFGAAILSFITLPLITHLIARAEFGKTSMFMMAYNMLLLVILLGVDQSFVRNFAQHDEKEQRFLLWNSLKIVMGFGLLALIPVFIFWQQISMYLFNVADINYIIILAVTLIFGLLGRFSFLLVRMKQRGVAFSIVTITRAVSRILAIILLALFYSKSFISIILAEMIANVVSFIVSVLVEIKFWFGEKKHHPNNKIKPLLKYGLPFIPTFIITWVFQYLDRIALREWCDFETLGLYTAAFKIVAALNLLKDSFTTFWVPVAYEHYEKHPNDKKFYEKMYLLVSVALFFVFILFLAFKDIIILMLNVEYRDAAMIMPFLLFMPIMYTLSEISVMGINFLKRTHWHIWIVVVAALVNLGGNFWLVPILGAKGAAISTGVAYIVFFVARTLVSIRIYKVNYHLIKTSVITMALFGFALYSTLVKFNYFHIIGAVSCLLLLVVLYYKSMKEMMVKVLDFAKKKIDEFKQ